MKKNEKKNEKKSVAATVAVTSSASSPLPPVGGADALPSVEAPTPPINDNPVALSPRKGMRVFQAEADVAENAARELRASTTFSEILGTKFGTAEQIADAIDFAVQWDAQAKAGATWGGYTKEQSHLAWNFALAIIDRLRGAFQAVVATDPAIEKELPNFTKLLAVRQTVAAKAVVTKKKIASGELVVKKRAKKASSSTTVSTPATSPAQAPAPAPAEATQAPVVAPEATPVAPSAPVVAH